MPKNIDSAHELSSQNNPTKLLYLYFGSEADGEAVGFDGKAGASDEAGATQHLGLLDKGQVLDTEAEAESLDIDQQTPVKNPWRDEQRLQKFRQRRDKIAAAYEAISLQGIDEDGKATPQQERFARRLHTLLNCSEFTHVATAFDPEINAYDIVLGETGAPKVQEKRCGHRCCVVCAARRSAKDAAKLAPIFSDLAGELAFITLTRQGIEGESLECAWHCVRKALDKLRRRDAFNDAINGALIKIEVTYSTPESRRAKAIKKLERAQDNGAKAIESAQKYLERCQNGGTWWHMHVHMLAHLKKYKDTGKLAYIKPSAMAELWSECLGTKGGADIQAPRGALFELTKYVMKPQDIDSMPQTALQELLKWIEQKKLSICWGTIQDAIRANSEQKRQQAPREYTEAAHKEEEECEASEIHTILERDADTIGAPISEKPINLEDTASIIAPDIQERPPLRLRRTGKAVSEHEIEWHECLGNERIQTQIRALFADAYDERWRLALCGFGDVRWQRHTSGVLGASGRREAEKADAIADAIGGTVATQYRQRCQDLDATLMATKGRRANAQELFDLRDDKASILRQSMRWQAARLDDFASLVSAPE